MTYAQMRLDYLQHVAAKFADPDRCLLWPFAIYQDDYAWWAGGRRRAPKRYAHRIVCELAHGPVPSSQHQVAHSCGNKGCVNPHHLRWATRVENEADKILHGLANQGMRHGMAKLSDQDVLQIRRSQLSQAILAAQFNVSQATISRVRARTHWRHL